MGLSVVLMNFRKKEIRQRMHSCAVPFYKQTMATIAAFLVIGGFIWGVCILVQAVIYQGGFFRDVNAGLYLVNSILCMLVALSLGYLTGTISNSPTAVNGMNNVISLGLCFLGGIFVPPEMLSDTVKKVACFLPTYWYSTVNIALGEHGSARGELMTTIRQGFLIQFLFAAACFMLTVVIQKKKNV